MNMKKYLAPFTNGNKHTTSAGFVFLGLAIARIWFPKYEKELQMTSDLVVTYGFVFASDLRRHKPGDDKLNEIQAAKNDL